MKGTFEKQARLAARSIELCRKPNPNHAIAGMADRVIAVAQAFLDLDEQVRQALTRLDEQERATGLAVAACGSAYDLARAVVLAHLPDQRLGGAASKAPTPDDLLHWSDQARAALGGKAGEEWADRAQEALSPSVDVARAAVVALAAESAAAQRVQAANRAKAEEFWKVLLAFRRVIRAAYGKTSREYRSLMLRSVRDAEIDGETTDKATGNAQANGNSTQLPTDPTKTTKAA